MLIIFLLFTVCNFFHEKVNIDTWTIINIWQHEYENIQDHSASISKNETTVYSCDILMTSILDTVLSMLIELSHQSHYYYK